MCLYLMEFHRLDIYLKNTKGRVSVIKNITSQSEFKIKKRDI